MASLVVCNRIIRILFFWKNEAMKFILPLLLILVYSGKAQDTLSFEEGTVSPKATLSEVAWMEGHWKGKAFGGITEEIWSPPLGGSMMFSFKLVSDGSVQFYEIGILNNLARP